MHTEKISVRITQSGQTMEVVVFDKRADHITVVLGEGMHSVKCELTPTRSGQAYVWSKAGSVCGNSARTDLCGGLRVTAGPIATPNAVRMSELSTGIRRRRRWS